MISEIESMILNCTWVWDILAQFGCIRTKNQSADVKSSRGMILAIRGSGQYGRLPVGFKVIPYEAFLLVLTCSVSLPSIIFLCWHFFRLAPHMPHVNRLFEGALQSRLSIFFLLHPTQNSSSLRSNFGLSLLANWCLFALCTLHFSGSWRDYNESLAGTLRVLLGPNKEWKQKEIEVWSDGIFCSLRCQESCYRIS